MNTTKDFYPHTQKSMAVQLGCHTSTVNTYLKRMVISPTEETYIGVERHYMDSVFQKLVAMGCGTYKRAPRAYNGITIDNEIPIPSASGMEKFPFHLLQVKQSFATTAESKSALEKQMTEANRKLAPAKFTRRVDMANKTVRVWRIE